jgi:DNA-binding winged helix-turn-helix (wHTH) protein
MAAEGQLGFGSFRFDGRSGRLWRDNGEVKLTPRAAAVLLALAERAQEVVTKQDIFERVWNGLAVSDDALTSCTQELRSVLGDDAKNPSIIETRHRRGYRLMLAASHSGLLYGRLAPPMAVGRPPAHRGETIRQKFPGTFPGLMRRQPVVSSSTLCAIRCAYVGEQCTDTHWHFPCSLRSWALRRRL